MLRQILPMSFIIVAYKVYTEHNIEIFRFITCQSKGGTPCGHPQTQHIRSSTHGTYSTELWNNCIFFIADKGNKKEYTEQN